MDIYSVHHYCGWGPYSDGFYASLEGAIKGFERKAKELRADSSYVRRSWHKNQKSYGENVVRHDSFQTISETNNENGREIWENDEYLEIRKETLHP